MACRRVVTDSDWFGINFKSYWFGSVFDCLIDL